MTSYAVGVPFTIKRPGHPIVRVTKAYWNESVLLIEEAYEAKEYRHQFITGGSIVLAEYIDHEPVAPMTGRWVNTEVDG